MIGTTTAIIAQTQGAKGVRIEVADHTIDLHVTPLVANDTTGAGDAFCGVFVAGIASGLSRVEAVERAVRAAAIAVTRPGAIASIPRRDELAAATP